MSLNTIKHLLIDMDGVLWRGDQPFPGLRDFFTSLRAHHVSYAFLTNNASHTNADYAAKFGGFGIEIEPEQVLTSANATAAWLAERLPPGASVYAVGEKGLLTALAEAGFEVLLHDTPDTVDAVVAGMYRGFDYTIIHHAARLVREGALYVGTNPDATYPSSEGLMPGAGSVIASISVAAGTEPTFIGKPSAYMFELALKRFGTRPGQTAMVGDRLETDILGGQRAGLPTILVLTGVTSAEDLATSDIQPTWVFDSIAELAAALDRHD